MSVLEFRNINPDDNLSPEEIEKLSKLAREYGLIDLIPFLHNNKINENILIQALKDFLRLIRHQPEISKKLAPIINNAQSSSDSILVLVNLDDFIESPYIPGDDIVREMNRILLHCSVFLSNQSDLTDIGRLVSRIAQAMVNQINDYLNPKKILPRAAGNIVEFPKNLPPEA